MAKTLLRQAKGILSFYHTGLTPERWKESIARFAICREPLPGVWPFCWDRISGVASSSATRAFKNVLTATISAGALVPKRLLYPRSERPKVLVDPLPRAHHENVVHFGSFVLSLFYLRRSNLTSLNQKGMVIGKGQQMRILTVALLVLDLAIIGYILRQIIEIVSVCW